MPLIQSASRDAISENIRREMESKPQRQAIAIALSNARKNGANIPPPKPMGMKRRYKMGSHIGGTMGGE